MERRALPTGALGGLAADLAGRRDARHDRRACETETCTRSAKLLGIEAPWFVRDVDARLDAREVEVFISFDDAAKVRCNESVADHEIAILRIGDTTDATLLGAYLDWMGENVHITDAPKNLLLRQEHMLQVLLHSNFDVTTRARLRIERALATYKAAS